MKNHNLITAILAAATVAAVPALAAADHRDDAGWTKLGEVGTHANDVEDFVPISPARRYDTIVVQARDGVVPLHGVKIQYADGRIATARVEVVGQRVPRIRYQGVRYDSVPITRVQPRDELRFNWHGGVFVRIN